MAGRLQQVVDQREVGRVVLGNQDARAHSSSIRQYECEIASLPEFALNVEAASERLGQLLTQVQAQTGPPRRPAPGRIQAARTRKTASLGPPR